MNHRTHYRCLRPVVSAAILLFVTFLCSPAFCDQTSVLGESGTEPTFLDVAYGPHPSNTLDFWRAPSDTPAPVIVQIHGGGFKEGDKSSFRHDVDAIRLCKSKGVSLASINYRFIDAAPIQDILRDSARAIQFLRYHAADWNIDKPRIICYGDSAGAGTSLWLAFHDDLSDPDSADPVLRESTRLYAAGALAPQATYDFAAWPAVLDIPQLVWHCCSWHISPAYYHIPGYEAYGKNGQKLRSELDMLSKIDRGDPPIYISSTQVYTPLTFGNLGSLAHTAALQWLADHKVIAPEKVKRDSGINFDILHHPAHGHMLEKTCRERGVPCTAVYRDTPPEKRTDLFAFFFARLGIPLP